MFFEIVRLAYLHQPYTSVDNCMYRHHIQCFFLWEAPLPDQSGRGESRHCRNVPTLKLPPFAFRSFTFVSVDTHSKEACAAQLTPASLRVEIARAKCEQQVRSECTQRDNYVSKNYVLHKFGIRLVPVPHLFPHDDDLFNGTTHTQSSLRFPKVLDVQEQQ